MKHDNTTRYMRCVNSKTKEFVDIQICLTTGTYRHFILLSADLLSCREDFHKDENGFRDNSKEKHYDFYALICKNEDGSILDTISEDGMYAGQDADLNMIRVNIDTLEYVVDNSKHEGLREKQIEEVKNAIKNLI